MANDQPNFERIVAHRLRVICIDRSHQAGALMGRMLR
jgi:hypothetical protein